MLFNLTEVIVAKDTPQEAARVLGSMLETCANKLDAMTAVNEELAAIMERTKSGEKNVIDFTFIEKARPVASLACAVEKPEEVLHGEWNLA
jgi:transformation/transcription domain-associated protein